jgi:hypothetical protein
MYSEFRDPFMVRIQSERSAEAQTQRRTNSDMKTPILSAVRRPGRIVNRMLNGAGLCVFAAWLLFSATLAQGAPTRQELIDYAKTTWELTDLTDDVISQSLDTSYSGIPFKDYVSLFIVTPDVWNSLAQGKYREAATKTANFVADQSVSAALEASGLAGVAAPGAFAGLVIQMGLYSLLDNLNDAAFDDQCRLYFEARQYLDAERIAAHADVDYILFNDQGWLHIVYDLHSKGFPTARYTSADFFKVAERLYALDQARIKSCDSDESIVRDRFRSAASPQKPVITQQPQDAVIASGQNATFTVQATGAGTLTYQWFFNGAWLSPAVGSSLQASAAGQYQVIVGNAAGTTPSRIATLTVNTGEPVAITAPPANANVSGSFTVRASVSGATKVEFYLDAVRQFTDSSTPFAWTWNTAIAANGAHALTAKAYNGATLLGTSAAVNVTVNNAAPPACSDPNEPNDSSPTATPLSFGIAASGYVCTATDVDWFKVEVATPGVLTFDLTVPAANDYDIELFGPDYAYIKGSYRDTGVAENITHNAISTGTYYVRVYGYPVGNGSHNTTTPYALTVGTASGPVIIVTPPQNRNVPAGANASFNVVASGASPLAYQWQRDSVDIPGATSPTYATPVLTLADSGAQFRVRVTNAFGFTFSAPASLSVSTANVITWTGAVSSDWNNRTNWNPMTMPMASDVVQLDSGNLNVPANAVFAVMNFAGGSLGGSFTNTGTLNWTGGTFRGQLVNGAGAVLAMTGGGDKVCDNYYGSTTVFNDGVIIWSGAGRLLTSGDSFYGAIPFGNRAGGMWEIQGDSQTAGGDYLPIFVFTNGGLLRKTGGQGTTTFGQCSFANQGTIEVQSGTLLFNTAFAQAASGTLQMGVGGLTPGSGFGRLVVNGQATLAGALNVTLINRFTPEFGDAFSVLSYNSRSGNFASINLPALPNALALTAQYTSSSLTLLTVNGGENNQTNAFQITRASNGLPELRFTGQPNHTYRLQASTNLVNWLNISTNTPVNGLLRFVDPAAVSIDHRFYRAVSP